VNRQCGYGKLLGVVILGVGVRGTPPQKFLVRERSALSDPYCQSTWMSVCVYATLRSNISETKGASG